MLSIEAFLQLSLAAARPQRSKLGLQARYSNLLVSHHVFVLHIKVLNLLNMERAFLEFLHQGLDHGDLLRYLPLQLFLVGLELAFFLLGFLQILLQLSVFYSELLCFFLVFVHLLVVLASHLIDFRHQVRNLLFKPGPLWLLGALILAQTVVLWVKLWVLPLKVSNAELEMSFPVFMLLLNLGDLLRVYMMEHICRFLNDCLQVFYFPNCPTFLLQVYLTVSYNVQFLQYPVHPNWGMEEAQINFWFFQDGLQPAGSTFVESQVREYLLISRLIKIEQKAGNVNILQNRMMVKLVMRNLFGNKEFPGSLLLFEDELELLVEHCQLFVEILSPDELSVFPFSCARSQVCHTRIIFVIFVCDCWHAADVVLYWSIATPAAVLGVLGGHFVF